MSPPASDAQAAAALKAEEKRRRRERKMRALVLKVKYQSEIDQWGILSNTLKEMQERASLEVGSRPEEEEDEAMLEEPGTAANDAGEGAGSEIDKFLAKGTNWWSDRRDEHVESAQVQLCVFEE